VIVTGVPRTGRDKLPDDYVPFKPSSKPYFPPAPETQRASSEFALPQESEPKRFWVTTEPPSKRVAERLWKERGRSRAM
jgi:hypothetical protein